MDNIENVSKWWSDEGCKLMNSKLVELTGQGIGKIPINNLFTLKLSGTQFDELIKIMAHDGCQFSRQNCQDDTVRYCIIIQ